MSASDALTVLQTLIALATGVLLCYYIVVTSRLQRQAQEQSRLQKEQLDVAKQELSQALFRERRLLLPHIFWRRGSSGPNEEKWEFENLGADVCNIRWSVQRKVDLQHEPRHLIRTFDEGFVEMRGSDQPISYPLRFTLAFTNRFGEACTRDFEIPGAATEPREVLPYSA
jgi:hypothetical protein